MEYLATYQLFIHTQVYKWENRAIHEYLSLAVLRVFVCTFVPIYLQVDYPQFPYQMGLNMNMRNKQHSMENYIVAPFLLYLDVLSDCGDGIKFCEEFKSNFVCTKENCLLLRKWQIIYIVKAYVNAWLGNYIPALSFQCALSYFVCSGVGIQQVAFCY